MRTAGLLGAILLLPLLSPAQDFPDFVYTEEPTPVAEDAESSPTAILAGEQLIIETWNAARARLEPAMDELRVLILTRAEQSDLQRRHEALLRDFDLMLGMVPHQAPNLEAAFNHQHARIVRQLELLMQDYQSEDWRQLENIDRQLLVSFREWNELLYRSDMERGDPNPDRNLLPADWNYGEFTSPGFAERVASWSASRLLGAYEERRVLLTANLRRKPTQTDFMIACEMGELARELAQRTYEVPLASRTTFQNSALRLDVLAENLYDFLREENYLHARRHARVIGKAVEETHAFLQLKDLGL